MIGEEIFVWGNLVNSDIIFWYEKYGKSIRPIGRRDKKLKFGNGEFELHRRRLHGDVQECHGVRLWWILSLESCWPADNSWSHGTGWNYPGRMHMVKGGGKLKNRNLESTEERQDLKNKQNKTNTHTPKNKI